MDVVAESVIEVYAQRDRIGGLQFTYEPEELRFFLARFEPLAAAPIGAASGDSASGPVL